MRSRDPYLPDYPYRSLGRRGDPKDQARITRFSIEVRVTSRSMSGWIKQWQDVKSTLIRAASGKGWIAGFEATGTEVDDRERRERKTFKTTMHLHENAHTYITHGTPRCEDLSSYLHATHAERDVHIATQELRINIIKNSRGKAINPPPPPPQT
ncbi:hypothetical protein MBM_00012 [Drepanopeziza brunnea f. sp. 'multigermtubi' MB_m1]|uniref:Uncharacterized protein n=1 Tax=Marssonina brunnea f. sp. multigermtubi (strain MB_m1) TaxID=1072389 RepID=K1Y6S5_MARBU|nr:uncharacterized protein MBM_00012 [Drepanopeziza brunnea f. sp. 'multigermtubi' MB_m1]EKD20899.1 hypothetical protein MBM_00012 [Drepanopeziza brunnea f. sp. 'multigermtubi' MB_m1]